MNFAKAFKVKPGKSVHLKDIDPDYSGKFGSEDEAREQMAENAKRLHDLQSLLYAEHKRSLLICLQAMDGGGKDGTISHVMGEMNPQGCRVASFKVPSVEESNHDFFWRAHKACPAKGEIAVFNRTYYEDVLVTRVHNLITKPVWEERYDQINALEKYLSQNDTHIIKFFLHISKEEQLVRFKARLDDPAKQWKISEADYKEREHWGEYMAAYGDMLARCSTGRAPWFIIPANKKWFRNLAVSQIIADYMEELNMQLPKPTANLKAIRKAYHKASKKE